MKLFLSVDMEGITGLVDPTFIDSSRHHYTRGQHLMTAEANHVIEAAFATGCQEVIVNDSHSKMNNIIIEQLHPEAKLISGDVKPFSMMQGMDDSFSAAVFVGYHARASMKGVLSHTMIFGVRNMYINDVLVGEFGLNAYLAGYYGVPVVLVTGDDEIAREAAQLIPGITAAVVKEQASRTAALCLSPQKSGELLRAKTAEALHNRGKVQPLVPPDNPVLKIEFANYGQAEWASLVPRAEIEAGTTIVSYEARNMLEAYKAMIAMTELAMKAAFS
ncbi:M55 family metallopeptidase [Numidum massiliense]|uniref:M55 family metallopeptidase n=1 Tax=Numidum massiliense TaxID=1522315 RepID=UPI0006D530CB|nr:M55 family metallopeptidase [Numidum massiliense]